MKNKKLIISIVVLVVVAVFAVLVFTKVIKLPSGNKVEDTTESTAITDDAYLQDVAYTLQSDLPYLQTEINGLYYTMDNDGNVKFYTLLNGVFTEQQATGTKDITVTMSESDVSAKVYYYKNDENIVGYGLYKAPADKYSLYSYALFHLMSYGKHYEDGGSNSCILGVDTTADDMYNDIKTYEEPFIYYFSDNSTSRLLSEANRTVGIDGTKRSDYSMINDTVVKYSRSHQLFFSGRQYAEADDTVDLLRSGGEGNNTDNVNLVKNVLGMYAAYNDNGDIRYIGLSDSGIAGVYEYNPGKDESTLIKQLDNTKKEDVFVSGDFVYSKAANKVVGILTGEEYTLNDGQSTVIETKSFVTDGKTAVIKGYINNLSPTLAVYNLVDGKKLFEYTNENFANCVNIHFTSDGKIACSIFENNKYTFNIFK